MMHTVYVWLIAVVLTAAASSAVVWKITASAGELRRMECVQAREVERREAAQRQADLFKRAESAETQAAQTLDAVRAEYQRKLKESRREIERLASGRECLSGALRLHLNTTLAADGLPTGSGAAAGSAAAAAADSGGASDAVVAGWISEASARYDDCRARLDAIRQWDELTHGR